MAGPEDFSQFDGKWRNRARLAWDTIDLKPTDGIPTFMVHVMDVPFIEDFTGHARGEFRRDHEKVYLEFQDRCGCCMIDQYIPDNPLTMGREGFDDLTPRSATTGAARVVLDGIEIDSPEAVVEHMERFAFPRLVQEAKDAAADLDRMASEIIQGELDVQRKFGLDILKVPYRSAFPGLGYYGYGYENYFAAYALYPEVMEKAFSLQADYSVLVNQAIARAVADGHLPPLVRLDHDMADSRGTLVDVRSLDRIYFPHFARAIEPLLNAGIRCIWHCDGNLSAMVPRLLAAGVGGFQGFQYEDGMDYVNICRMRDRDGGPLLIIAGVSVTRTLPMGGKQDVIDHMNWLVANGPPVGMFLGPSSSVVPGTSSENIRTMIEGLQYFRTHGRSNWPGAA